MTKADLLRELVRRTNLSRAEAARVVDAILETITEALRIGDSISFAGFGRFSVASAATRQPAGTRGGAVIVRSTRRVSFKAAGRLEAAVRGGESTRAKGSSRRKRSVKRSRKVAAAGGGGDGAAWTWGGGGLETSVARVPYESAASSPRRTGTARRSRRPVRANGGGAGARRASSMGRTPREDAAAAEKHVNAWIAGREGRPRRAPLQPDTTYDLMLNVGEPVDAKLLRGDTTIDTSGLPEQGLVTEWLLSSRSVRLEPADGEPIESARTGQRGGWMARFELLIPKYTDSEIRTLAVTPLRRSTGRIDLVIKSGGEIYRELVIALDVASPSRRPRRRAAGVERELVHTPAAHLGLQPPHEWTTPPGHLTIAVGRPMASVSGDAGNLAIAQPTQWFGAPSAVSNPIESVRAAAERFRATADTYLNALDADELEARLRGSGPVWWGSKPEAHRRHTELWKEVSRSRELREFAAEGRLLYDAVFPQGSEIRDWLDLLEPGHRLDISWLDVDEGWVPHMPWGLMYAGEIPRPGEPVDPLRFLALHLRIGYMSHFVKAASKALGSRAATYCGNFLYWGAGDRDVVAEEAARQRADLASWPGQLIWPSVPSDDPKAEVLAALDAPSPPPVGVLYFFCQSSYGARRDDPVLGFASPIVDTSAIRRTELGMRVLDERPFVFANACTSGVSDAYFANDLEQSFFRRGARAFLGTETKVPIEFASRFARTFFHFFYRQADQAPMAAGEAVVQARHFLWHHYRNIGGIFYTHVNQYELFMADDAEVRALRA